MSDRDPRFDQEKRDEAARLYREGLSERAVAKRLGVSKQAARNYLDDAGVRRRSRSAAQRRSWRERARSEPR